MYKYIIRLILLVFILFNLLFSQYSTADKKKSEFLTDLVSSFKTEFLWESKGQFIAKELTKIIESGKYSSLRDSRLFVETLNRDLYKLSNDLHLTVSLNKTESIVEPLNSSSTLSPIFLKETVGHGIYYLKFDEFPRINKSVKKELNNVMTSLQDASTIILDLRENSGGSDDLVNYLAGFFFEKKTKLAFSFQWGAESKEIWATPKKQSKKLSRTKLMILTSQSTFSAAEIFTQRLQLHGRAIVIGERTPGAAHRTQTYLMSDTYLLQWPYERSEHIVENRDLEGIGIIPDYPIHYNNTKEFAINMASSKNHISKKYEMSARIKNVINELVTTLNMDLSISDETIISKHVDSNNHQKIMRALRSYNLVWNTSLNHELTNIHIIDEKYIRIFLENDVGTIQMKIGFNSNDKIEKVMYRL